MPKHTQRVNGKYKRVLNLGFGIDHYLTYVHTFAKYSMHVVDQAGVGRGSARNEEECPQRGLEEKADGNDEL